MATAETERADEIGADAATPPRRPAPMPTQEITFWTPALVVSASLRAARTILHPRRSAPSPVISASSPDEPS